MRTLNKELNGLFDLIKIGCYFQSEVIFLSLEKLNGLIQFKKRYYFDVLN